MAENNENEIFESPEALAEQINKTEDFIIKNKTIFIGVLAAIVLLVAGIIFWKNNNAANEEVANNAIYKAQYFYGLDSIDLALNGNGDDFEGFTSIADKYSGTSAGVLVEYYLGCIALKKGEFEEAANKFSEYDSDAFLVQARAYALAGDAYSDLGKTEEAITYYVKAVKSQPNKEYTPGYIIKLALAYENADRIADAVIEYENFVANYPNDKNINNVYRYLAKAREIASKKK